MYIAVGLGGEAVEDPKPRGLASLRFDLEAEPVQRARLSVDVGLAAYEELAGLRQLGRFGDDRPGDGEFDCAESTVSTVVGFRQFSGTYALSKT